MKLTTAQEATLLRQYDPLLWSFVNEFHHKGGSRGVDNTEDLIQEARLEFLRHLRRISDPSEIVLCRFHILGALCAYCRTMALVKIPKYCFSQKLRELECEEGDPTNIIEEQEAMDDDTLFNVVLHDFLGSLPAEEQLVVQMKLAGYTSREIIPVVKAKGEPQMSRLLSRVRKKARAFFMHE